MHLRLTDRLSLLWDVSLGLAGAIRYLALIPVDALSKVKGGILMSPHSRTPGFTADVVLEVGHDSEGPYAGPLVVMSNDRLTPQAARGCGFAIGVGIFGLFTGNPALVAAAVAGAASWCD